MKGQQARDRCGQSHGAAAEPGIRLDLNMYIHCNDDGGRRSRLANLVSKSSLFRFEDIELTSRFSKWSATSL